MMAPGARGQLLGPLVDDHGRFIGVELLVDDALAVAGSGHVQILLALLIVPDHCFG